MKTLYLDCGMGAAGDMLTAALLELLPEPDAFVAKLNAVGIPGIRFSCEPAVKCGITGTHVRVTVNGAEEGEFHHDHHHEHDHGHDHHHDHHHSGMDDIAHIVRGHLDLPDKVKEQVLATYGLIAAAESRVHGVPVTEVHFHEVGAMDALADVTAVCLLLDALAPDRIVASPVHVGAGHVHCAHGILPVPAPATAELLKGVPVYGGAVDGELCTPTGAALLRQFVTAFGEMPVMTVERVGYGMGTKDFARANCVRAILGESADKTDDVLELSFNVDDMTAEEIGFATEMLFASGANEVFTVPVGMKKNRPGTLICVLCEPAKKDEIVKAVFQHTTTIGIRESAVKRTVLDRAVTSVETPYGAVSKKTSQGYGVTRAKFEYDDLARIAKENGLSLREARKALEEADD